MENIFGVIVFVLFIALRAIGDRKKGMKKEPVKVKTRPQAGNRPIPSREEPVGMGKPSMQKAPLERRVLEPIQIGQPPIQLTQTKPLIGEGESNYDKLSYMEGVKPEKEIVRETPQTVGKEYQVRGLFEGPEDLQRAIIWSEIIQKPRFKKRIYSR
ncbi:MAG: hypothetical protein CVU87_04580 [Firmicutes bacterium HGW-Firmicutes-12]|nr:MAG: hypothetical protein CVU87_04580 [Firmicutes bacterium HGW-Firmicutes-12]